MNLDKALGIHAQTLVLRSQRAELLAGNIANADTPNYKAKDFDFQATLARSEDKLHHLKQTHASHISTGLNNSSSTSLLYRQPNQPSLDGNTVDPHLERSEYMQNAIMYQASLRFLSGKVSGLIAAIRGE